MFKITMLQQWYGLSNMAVEYHINDSLSYMRFLGLKIGDKVPDGNTIWDFKEAMKENEVDRKLFDLFNEKLEAQGVITYKGSIVDASFVTVPKRHTTKKDDESFFGFKDLVKCDSKIIGKKSREEILEKYPRKKLSTFLDT